MKLFCDCCSQVHSFTESEVERIIYALSMMESCARGEPAEHTHIDPEPVCLRHPLSESHDIEALKEWTDDNVELRKAKEGADVPLQAESPG